jgi:hypothetical protein
MVQKRCRHCRELFEPEPRAAKVQKYCKETECQQARQRKKYEHWIRQPGNAAAHQDALRAWAKDYPDYWRHYRQTHGTYRERERQRMRATRRRIRRVAKQTDWRQIAVERLDAIEAEAVGDCSAKQTDLLRRVSGIVGYLRWTVKAPIRRKATDMAWVGGTGG